MILSKWNQYSDIEFGSATQALLIKLKILKFDVIPWEKEKKTENQVDLVQIELELNTLAEDIHDLFYDLRKERVLSLEASKQNFY